MKSTVLAFVLACVSVLPACGGGEATSLEQGPGAGAGAGAGAGGNGRGGAPVAGEGGGSTAPQAAACPAGLAAVKTLADEATATDVRLVGDLVYFRAGAKVHKVGRDGAGKGEVYTDPSLVRAWADDKALAVVESPNPPDAVLKVIDLPVQTDKGARAAATNLNAASTFVFGSDATSFYLVADGNEGDEIYRLDKATAQLQQLAKVDGVVSDPQVAASAIWYVRDQKRVFKIELTEADPGNPLAGKTAAPPAEVFGIGYASCNLAVSDKAAFCGLGGAIEQRELSGANPRTLLEAQKSTKASSPFGPALYAGDALLVRSTSNDALKTIVRAIKATPGGAEETLVACGRPAIGAVSADGKGVAWTEPGAGVMYAPR